MANDLSSILPREYVEEATDERVTLRFTRTQLERITLQAKSSGLKPSVYIRMILEQILRLPGPLSALQTLTTLEEMVNSK